VLSLEDDRWNQLIGGYRIPFDPRPLIRELEASPEEDQLWSRLIEELYHQGDVDTASYAAIPLLVKVFLAKEVYPWQLFALIGWIESARAKEHNPRLPDWLRASYPDAIESLSLASLRAMKGNVSYPQVQGMLCVLALWKGLAVYADALIRFSEEELKEFLPH
jgi:hypothetical protein